MFVGAIAGIDHAAVQLARQQFGRARILVAADAPIGVALGGHALEYIPTLHPSELFLEYTPPVNSFSNISSHRPLRDQGRLYRFDSRLLQPGANTLELRNDSDNSIEVGRINLGLW